MGSPFFWKLYLHLVLRCSRILRMSASCSMQEESKGTWAGWRDEDDKCVLMVVLTLKLFIALPWSWGVWEATATYRNVIEPRGDGEGLPKKLNYQIWCGWLCFTRMQVITLNRGLYLPRKKEQFCVEKNLALHCYYFWWYGAGYCYFDPTEN